MKPIKNKLIAILFAVAATVSLAVFSACDISALEGVIPGGDDEHVHEYVDGACECGQLDPSAQNPDSSLGGDGGQQGGTTPTDSSTPDDSQKPDSGTHEHDWDEWKYKPAPTCLEGGKRERTCTTCPVEESEELSALGHKFMDGMCENEYCTELDPDYTASVGLRYTYIEETDSYEVTDKYNCTDTDVIIPDTYRGKPVTVIGEGVFQGRWNGTTMAGIHSISISENVTTLERYAFSSNWDLEQVTFRGNTKLQTIGDGAFNNCKGLTEISIPDTVTAVGNEAFAYCEFLLKVNFGENSALQSIGASAFTYCHRLTSFTLGSSVTTIGDMAFQECVRLVEIYNKSTLSIAVGGEDGYIGCYAKDVYTQPYTTKLSVNENGCILYTDGEEVSLIGYVGTNKHLVIPDTVTKINVYAFYYYNDAITKITIPESVTEIGINALYGCNLTKMTIVFKVTEGWLNGETPVSAEWLADPAQAVAELGAVANVWTRVDSTEPTE